MQTFPFTLFFLRNRKLSGPPPYLTPAAEDTKDFINMACADRKTPGAGRKRCGEENKQKTGCVIPFFQIMIYQYATP